MSLYDMTILKFPIAITSIRDVMSDTICSMAKNVHLKKKKCTCIL